MLCPRCGVANAEAVSLCRNCGASLKRKLADPTAVDNLPGQSPADGDEERAALPIDQLPTAHVPSVAGPSNFVQAAQPPFGKEFPLELEQPVSTQPLPGETHAPLPSSQSTFQTPSAPSPDLQEGSDPQALPSDIADYPTRTGVPIPPPSALTGLRPATTDLPERQASSPSPVPEPPPLRPGRLSLPSRKKPGPPTARTGIGPLQPDPATPAGGALLPTQSTVPQPGSANIQPAPAMQPTQPGPAGPGFVPPPAPATQATEIGAPPVQPRMATPPSQPGIGPANVPPGPRTPPSQPGIGPINVPPGVVAPPPAQAMGIGSLNMQPRLATPPSQPGIAVPPVPVTPPSQPRVATPPSQPGIGPLNVRPGAAPPPAQPGMYPPPVAPERSGNAYPGPRDQAAPGRQTNQPAEQIHRFVQPLPRWAVLGGPIVGALLLLGLVFLNPDWAMGALIAGIVALLLLISLATATGIRISRGLLKENNPRRLSQAIRIALLLLLLLLFSGIGFSQQSGLHVLQGRYLESRQSWAAAISAYQAGGERSSAAEDVARTYDEWGEAQDSQQQYAGAVTSFNMVIQNYQQATDEFSRAKKDIVAAYLGWASQASEQQNYADATAHYDALLSLVFCNADTCMQLAQTGDATAYYHLAEQQLAEGHYSQAVNAYQTLKVRFPNAPETGQIHAHYAQALWGEGQQQLSTTCSNAVTTYRLLAQLFGDTSQGQQAATALTKSVQVTGRFTQSIPGAPYHPTAFLVQGLVVGIQQDQFPPLLTHAPSATIHQDGSFTFTSVPQGVYELVWSSDGTLHFYYASSGQHVLYTAHLGPLCTYNYGDVNQTIPTGTQ